MADPAEERLGVYAEIDRENGVFPRGGPDGEVGSSCPFSLDGLCSDILKSILYRRYTLLDCRECVNLKTVKRFSPAAFKKTTEQTTAQRRARQRTKIKSAAVFLMENAFIPTGNPSKNKHCNRRHNKQRATTLRVLPY